MRLLFALLAMLAGTTIANTADADAGKARATAVCAACHGSDGMSVAADIPNLAGQKVGYLISQLRAFKAGERKNLMMNPIASQLDDQDIEDVAMFFASLPGTSVGSVQSGLLPNVAKTRVSFPADYGTHFTRYLKLNFPHDNRVSSFYANPAALEAASTDAPLPDGSMILVETFSARLDEHDKPIKGSDGFFVPDRLAGYGAMERQAGWGAEIPEMLRNDDWNYASFGTDKVHRGDFNHARCLACHKPLPADSYLFTMKQLREFARTNRE